MAADIYKLNGTGIKTVCYRQFFHTSWFANPSEAMNKKRSELMKKYSVNHNDVVITAFNRC